jgi:predicted HD superfamily hydrolase involved in NAD metabolism
VDHALPSEIEARLAGLPAGLREHVKRARDVGRELAARHDVDEGLVDLGLAAHDLARGLNADKLRAEALRHGLNITLVERHAPMLLHGPVAAQWLEHEGTLTHDSVLQAVRWHTTGVPGMTRIAKVVFLADKLDPHKVAEYPYLQKVKSLAAISVDEAILEHLDRVIEYLLGRKLLVHPASLELRNELVASLES